MRRILSVAGVLCLLMAGAAWAQTDEGTAKSKTRKISGILTHLTAPNANVGTRMLNSIGLQRGARFHIAVHAKDLTQLQTLSEAYGQLCRQVGANQAYTQT